MKQQSSSNIYEGLASYLLPDGILNYFEVVDFAETPSKSKGQLYDKMLDIYLDERDNRPADKQSTRPNGFTTEIKILDFPVRARKTILHVRRRRWLTEDDKDYIVPLEKIAHDKTRYSKEFALFLKGIEWTPSR